MPAALNTPNMASWAEMVRRTIGSDPSSARFGVVLLQATAEGLSDLVKHATVADVLDVSGNTEATATGYSRVTWDGTDIDPVTVDVDGTPPRVFWTPPSGEAFASIGNGTNNTIETGFIYWCEDEAGGDDDDRFVIHSNIFATPFTTDGGPLAFDFPSDTMLAQLPEEPTPFAEMVAQAAEWALNNTT